ncbi:Putative secreted protein [Xanthomonas campestris pv. campestris]|uniref:Secreted protein n=2 Tax=Xanthomonas campestris TaxID=339 RepID=B0RW94_XANCB|nr:Putative secreted protein [Xanthomonas campestris pv. campestris]
MFPEPVMPLSFSRLLSLAMAAVLSLSLAAPADAAKKKTGKAQTSQTRAKAGKAKKSTKPARSTKAKAKPRAVVAPVVQSKAQQLTLLYDQYWDASLKLNPLQATFQGESRYNDQLPNFLSPAFRQQSHDFTTLWLAKVEAIGPDGLSGQDLLSYQIFVRDARSAQAAEQFPSWMLPINQFYNIASIAVVMGSGTGAQPFNTVKDYDNWSRRALGIPDLFDQAITNMRAGMQAGVVQPKALMEKVLPQLDAIIARSAEESLFWGPIRNLPADMPEADKQRITAEYKRMIEFRIMPAYRALRGFIATEYLPACRDTAGLAALPNGAAWYAYDVRQSTTSDLTPAQIHQTGLDEVARLQGEIQNVAKQVKFRGNLPKFYKFMQTDKRFVFRSESELLDAYRGLQSRVQAAVPRLFATQGIPALDVRPVEPQRAQAAASGSYMRPNPHDNTPGIFYVNTSNLPARPRWEGESLFLHEGVPGHHYQLGLQQQLTDLPKFRRFGGETAFIEGWGLYAESLGRELGLYQDPYNYYGYLQNALLRSIRLVVDTGLHSQGWTRAQAIDYMLQNSAVTREDAEAEVDRYLAIPGQALAYKVGEMKISQLREQAQRELGPRFDVRAFHTEVLKDGSVPLEILQNKVQRWIATQKG